MPWDFYSVVAGIPPSQQDRYQSLLIRANMLGPLPTSEKKALVIDANDLEVVFFKAFEETFPSLDAKYFETRLKRLKATVGDANSLKIYFPGVNLHISNGESNLYISHFRVAPRNAVGYDAPAA